MFERDIQRRERRQRWVGDFSMKKDDEMVINGIYMYRDSMVINGYIYIYICTQLMVINGEKGIDPLDKIKCLNVI